jgi:hypothetical protein
MAEGERDAPALDFEDVQAAEARAQVCACMLAYV